MCSLCVTIAWAPCLGRRLRDRLVATSVLQAASTLKKSALRLGCAPAPCSSSSLWRPPSFRRSGTWASRGPAAPRASRPCRRERTSATASSTARSSRRNVHNQFILFPVGASASTRDVDPYGSPLLGRHAQRVKVVVVDEDEVADAARAEGRDRVQVFPQASSDEPQVKI